MCSQKIADLPKERVTPGQPPFSHVGIDYFGSFMVKQGRSQVKRYTCIFMCLTIRAVHIEIIHSLDTDYFINTLILNTLLNEQVLNDEGLLTLMCEVEAVINGRPITKVSKDSRDLEALSPNHLLLV